MTTNKGSFRKKPGLDQAIDRVNNLNRQAQPKKSPLSFIQKMMPNVSGSHSCPHQVFRARQQPQVNRASRMIRLRGPRNVPWNPTTPGYRTTSQKPVNHSTRGGRDTKKTKTISVLPLGGGKLRCSDVLGLGSGRGSCLNPRGEADRGMGKKWSKGSWLDKPFSRGYSVQWLVCDVDFCDEWYR